MEDINEILASKSEANIIKLANDYVSNPVIINSILIACFFRLHNVELVNKIADIIRKSNNAESIKLLNHFIVPNENKKDVNPWDIPTVGIYWQKKKYPDFYELCAKYEKDNDFDSFMTHYKLFETEYEDNVNNVRKKLNKSVIDLPMLLNMTFDYDLEKLFNYIISSNELVKQEIIDLFINDGCLMFNTLKNNEIIHMLENLHPDIRKSQMFLRSIYYTALVGLNYNLMAWFKQTVEGEDILLKCRFPDGIYVMYQMLEKAFELLPDEDDEDYIKNKNAVPIKNNSETPVENKNYNEEEEEEEEAFLSDEHYNEEEEEEEEAFLPDEH